MDLVESFPKEAAMGAIEALEDSISRPEAMRRLGLTQNQLKILEQAEILPVLRPGANLKPRHARGAVEQLLSRIEARIVGTVDGIESEWVTVFRLAGRAKTSVPVLLSQIMEGHLTEVRAVSGERGLARVRLCLADVLALRLCFGVQL